MEVGPPEEDWGEDGPPPPPPVLRRADELGPYVFINNRKYHVRRDSNHNDLVYIPGGPFTLIMAPDHRRESVIINGVNIEALHSLPDGIVELPTDEVLPPPAPPAPAPAPHIYGGRRSRKSRRKRSKRRKSRR